jgi:hypothetical protein
VKRRKVDVAGHDPKGMGLCEARNQGRREIEGIHVPDRSRGAKKCVEPGNEHKEKPSGASTNKETEIAYFFFSGYKPWNCTGRRTSMGTRRKTIDLVRE